METWFSRFVHWCLEIGAYERVAIVLGVVLLLVIGRMVSVVTRSRSADRQMRLRKELTVALLEKGIPADDMVRVLAAAFEPHGEPQEDEEECEEEEEDEEVLPQDREAQIVHHLSENGYDCDDIERVLAVARQRPIDEPTLEIVRKLAEDGAEADGIERILKSRNATPSVAGPITG